MTKIIYIQTIVGNLWQCNLCLKYLKDGDKAINLIYNSHICFNCADEKWLEFKQALDPTLRFYE